jgi:hypothetical protein
MKHTRESIIAFINDCRKNGKRIDLSGQDLSGLDLRWADLRGADLRATDLQDANLRGANLQEADLQEADFDFAGYELSCQTIGMKVGRRLVSQLLYHLCSMDVLDCPEWDELRNDERVIALANQSHVIPVHVLPKIKPLKAQEEEK